MLLKRSNWEDKQSEDILQREDGLLYGEVLSMFLFS